MVAQRDHGQAEMHQARLQAAQITLQLADSSLALREGRAHWAQERQNLQRTVEVLHRSRTQSEVDDLEFISYLYSGNVKVWNIFSQMSCYCPNI